MKVLNIGSLNIDRVYEVEHFVKPGETIKTTHYSEACGGKGLNQSIARDPVQKSTMSALSARTAECF